MVSIVKLIIMLPDCLFQCVLLQLLQEAQSKAEAAAPNSYSCWVPSLGS